MASAKAGSQKKHDTNAYSLNSVRAGLSTAQHRRFNRLNGNDV